MSKILAKLASETSCSRRFIQPEPATEMNLKQLCDATPGFAVPTGPCQHRSGTEDTSKDHYREQLSLIEKAISEIPLNIERAISETERKRSREMGEALREIGRIREETMEATVKMEEKLKDEALDIKASSEAGLEELQREMAKESKSHHEKNIAAVRQEIKREVGERWSNLQTANKKHAKYLRVGAENTKRELMAEVDRAVKAGLSQQPREQQREAGRQAAPQGPVFRAPRGWRGPGPNQILCQRCKYVNLHSSAECPLPPFCGICCVEGAHTEAGHHQAMIAWRGPQGQQRPWRAGNRY